MRSVIRCAVVLAGIASGFIVACGSSDESQFNNPTGEDDSGVGSSSGSFNPPSGNDGGPSTCKPRTCADVGANCGPVGDGCGGVIKDCGKCAGEETCGGGGKPSVCGKPSCTPKTCQELGANCGPVGDGCGGLIQSCGTCTVPGESCGGGGPSRCGVLTDGDGGTTTCTPKTCQQLGADCGPIGDGCGGLIASCGTCNAPATCGGGGTASLCGGGTCTKKTCAQAGANCGPIADGCGGIVQCGTCNTAAGEQCGAVTANVCGMPPTTCTTGLCTQQVTCPGGATTSISGKVLSPAGNLPIYGATVYVPLSTPAAFAPGVACDQCTAGGANALISVTTGPDGTFLLPNMPVSDPAKVQNIPVVVQLGRWRRQITVQTTACTNTAIDINLPKNKTEGDIPLTAISTGDVDGLECVLRKIGIQDSEFTNPSGTGRVRLYQDNGAIISTGNWQCTKTGSCSGSGQPNNTCKNNGGTCVYTGTPAASTLYGSQAELDKYDMVIFGCVGAQQNKAAADKQRVQAYANKGGRVYATHFSYVWLYDQTPWSGTASWKVNQDSWNSVTADVDTSFTKGQAFAQWLNIVGALSNPLPNPQITISEARHDVDMPATAPAQKWLSTTAPKSSMQHYTYATPWGSPPANQCGRVLFSDFHVTVGSGTQDVKFPAECDNNPLTAQEKVLAFMLFDLASCVSTGQPPTQCSAKTCAQQNLQCGLAGDGCGNQIDCGPCPDGTTCGGGGVASKCGAPSCTKLACQPGQCGFIADGCGGSLNCGTCATGTCGGGGTNICGGGVCTPTGCPAGNAGDVCGPVANGCGGINTCPCAGGAPCVNGKCGAPTCTPRTCQQAGANCGQVADGCGGILDCGVCIAPQTCGGGGVVNVCGGGVN